jgi:hypothetical protein
MTPRQAAYRDLCTIIAQLSGRSRRAQRSLLETALARALERAYDFQSRCAQLSATVASQQDRVLGAEIEIALERRAARERVQNVRQEVVTVLEACQTFEALGELFLSATRERVAVEPPPMVVVAPAPAHAATDAPAATGNDVDDEAVTERVPGSKGWPSAAKP